MILLGGYILPHASHFSQNEAVLSEHQRIVEQNPFDGQHNSKVSEHSLLIRVGQTNPKLFFLSPDQQAALKGSARQFIIGAAGTGKTVVLQAKALQLLSEGETVVVFSPECYKEQYQKLFDSYGLKNYQCLKWPHGDFHQLYSDLGEYFDKLKLTIQKLYPELDHTHSYYVEEVSRHIHEYVNSEATAKLLDWLLYKNVMIDDSCDQTQLYTPKRASPSIRSLHISTSFFVAWSLMEYIGAVCPTKIAWIVLDPTTTHSYNAKDNSKSRDILRAILEGLLSNSFEHGGAKRVRVSVLRQVMRCCESVFLGAYAGGQKLPWIRGTEPILAHKIQGLKAETVSEFFDSVTPEDAMSRFCDKIRETLGRISREGIDMANVAVVLGAVLPDECRDYFDDASIPYYEFDEVSSMEWPVVIYASCFPVHFLEDVKKYAYSRLISYPRYRATTRATTRVIDISVVYKPPEDSGSQDL